MMKKQERFGSPNNELFSEMTHHQIKLSNYYSCIGKKRYKKFSNARNVMEGMKAQFVLDSVPHSLNVYLCVNCKRYHIGNNNKKSKEVIYDF